MSSDGAPQTPLTVRALLQGKEAGSIIGKGGEVIKRFRDESGAHINIAAGTAMERMLTVSGTIDIVFQAFQLIMVKLNDQSDGRVGDLTLRLVVPASQCGSIIGKGGARIKEIREDTGAHIQVGKDMLLNSTDRTVVLTGSPEQIAHCVQLISNIMVETTPSGDNIPYKPLANNGGPAGGGVGFRGPGFPRGGRYRNNDGGNFNSRGNFNGGGPHGGRYGNDDNFGRNFGGRGGNFSGNFNNPGNFGANFNQFEGVTTYEMSIPAERAGSVIGKGGSRIAEIRQRTGASVTMSQMEASPEDDGAKQDRLITIKGHSEQVDMAVYMINSRVESMQHHQQETL